MGGGRPRLRDDSVRRAVSRESRYIHGIYENDGASPARGGGAAGRKPHYTSKPRLSIRIPFCISLHLVTQRNARPRAHLPRRRRGEGWHRCARASSRTAVAALSGTYVGFSARAGQRERRGGGFADAKEKPPGGVHPLDGLTIGRWSHGLYTDRGAAPHGGGARRGVPGAGARSGAPCGVRGMEGGARCWATFLRRC